MTRHPAKYSDEILPLLQNSIEPGWKVLDPFAGTGRIHLLDGVETWGVELEPEWASMHPRTIVANALYLPFANATFDAIVTSCVYGNRMSDHHNARDASRRVTYTHCLGRKLHADNAGQLHWGPKYREFHVRAWLESARVLKPGGRFVLNISDFMKKDEVQPVTAWHMATLEKQGLHFVRLIGVQTKRMRFGANGEKRTGREYVITFKKGDAWSP